MANHIISLTKLITDFVWHCFGWSMVGPNTYHTGHSYGAPLWRNMGSWGSLHVEVVLLVAWDCKREIRASSSLASWTVFWMTVSISTLNVRKLCVKFFPVNIMIDTTKSTRHVIDQTTSYHQWFYTANEVHRRSAFHQGRVVSYCGIYRVEPRIMLAATMYSCWAHLDTMTSCSACFVSFTAIHVYDL